MAGWNFADIWEIISSRLPNAPAQIQGARRYAWATFDRRANGVALALLDAGAGQQAKVAQYLTNCPEYMESIYAAFKAGLVPVNTNYRYLDDELVYLWDNADVVAVVFHGSFAERVSRVRHRVPSITTWLWVDDGAGSCPQWAVPYEEAAASGTSTAVTAPWGRDGDHLLLLYTGGTTGMPKGVMWRQDDLFRALVGNGDATSRSAPVDYDIVRRTVTQPGVRSIPASPLMHGTAQFTQLVVLSRGGSTVTLTRTGLDVNELLSTIEREQVNAISVVGDTFAVPILDALDIEPDRWDLSSLVTVASSGVMWSDASKQRLLNHLPDLTLIDAFSSSEALGMGHSMTTANDSNGTAAFAPGRDTVVLADDGRRVVPGSGQIGRVAVGGFQPIGYYKDDERTAATFVTWNGRRFSVPGDYARVESDGTLTLLGRGSGCINTGGEKVFPEEVEEVLKTHPAVRDAAIVGVPDRRLGEAITALVELDPSASVDNGELVAHVKQRLAAYKAPKHLITVDTIGRSPNGKLDYRRLRTHAENTTSSTDD